MSFFHRRKAHFLRAHIWDAKDVQIRNFLRNEKVILIREKVKILKGNLQRFKMGEITMNKQELEKIKKEALDDHVPIIMDDTLQVISEILTEKKPIRILEIGAAVRIFSYMFFRIFK